MKKLAIFFATLVCQWSGLKGDVNMTEYYQMPPMYELEDFDRCMDEFPTIHNLYCFARTQIKPNESSVLWQYIQSFSSNTKRHFRHDRLNRGVCMNWCISKVKDFDRRTRREYYVARFDNNIEITFDPNSIPNALLFKAKYDKHINICMNYKLSKQYGLMAYSEIEYCISSGESHSTDELDIVVAVLFFTLLIIVASSTYYDFKLKLRNSECSRHYKNPVLGALGVTMQMLIWKYPRCRKFVLSSALVVSLIVPGVITYVNRYEGIFMIRPEMVRYAHWFDDMYRNVYIPSHTNFGSFVCGMIGGTVYMGRKSGFKKKMIIGILWHALVPAALLLLLSAFIFYEYDFAKPAIWISIYSALIRNLWGVFIASFITGMAFGYGWIIKDIFSHPIFRSLGRLTFCAYLIHPAIIRLLVGDLRQPIWVSDVTIVVLAFSVFPLSYIAALLLCLGLELPTTALQKHFQLTGNDRNEKSSTSNESSTLELK